jgi:hypothetical protein
MDAEESLRSGFVNRVFENKEQMMKGVFDLAAQVRYPFPTSHLSIQINWSTSYSVFLLLLVLYIIYICRLQARVLWVSLEPSVTLFSLAITVCKPDWIT